MGSFVVIGEEARVCGFALAGAEVITAEGPTEVRRALEALSDDATVVLLSANAAAALDNAMTLRNNVLTVVMPP